MMTYNLIIKNIAHTDIDFFSPDAKGAGVDPTWMNVNISQIAREWFRSMDVGVDIDDVMPEQPPMQQQGMMPMGMPQMGGIGGIGGGSPVAIPPPQPQQITAGGPQPAAGNIV